MKKRMLLYFGSFDPVHNGHIALAEYAIEHNLADEVALIISPQNPFKADLLQTPEYTRYEMTEMACKESKYPEQIKPSVIEFVLEKPSYTINTLDYLKENCGDVHQSLTLVPRGTCHNLLEGERADPLPPAPALPVPLIHAASCPPLPASCKAVFL